MKNNYIILILLAYQIIHAQIISFEKGINGDTINAVDNFGKKQGKWIIKGKNKQGTCYTAEQKVEEGKYLDNRKIGKWLEYYCNGNLKNQVTFQNGRPEGYVIMYHESGKIMEEGNWKNGRWTGSYKLYYENGQLQHEFNFNTSGKREGNIKYYHPNGQIAIEGNFINGKETGIIKEYHENGDVKAEKMYVDGAADLASIKEFEPKKPPVKIKDTPLMQAPKLVLKEDERPNGITTKGPLILNGQHITYNKKKLITKDGVFKDNRLIEGKSYIYDDNGILQRISIYKNGFYVGDAPIEN
jgi:antitoxin component YwqK of YwqJK toxin-antitoxin module